MVKILYGSIYDSLQLFYDLTHAGYQLGRRYEMEISRYDGKYGKGYIVRHPSLPNSKYHMVEYWTN